MAHDNYGKWYTWDKSTLILDPGVFAWDEPHLSDVCQQTLPYANAFDRMADPVNSRKCRKPARLVSFKHSSVPAKVLKKCETVVPGEAYCCPQYVMPENWQFDYMPMGQEEDMQSVNGALTQEAQVFMVEARKIGEQIEGGVAPVAVEMSAEAQALYEAFLKEVGIAAQDVQVTVAPVVKQVRHDIVDPAVDETRTTVQKWPLMSLGLGIAGGLLVGRMLGKRR